MDEPEFVTAYPATSGEAFQFLVAWKWATLTALENGWLSRGDAAALEAHGERLAALAQTRIEGEAK